VGSRAGIVSQAQVGRALRACRKDGRPVARIIVKPDRVELEVGVNDGESKVISLAPESEVIL
jgi:hypothetical protein